MRVATGNYNRPTQYVYSLHAQAVSDWDLNSHWQTKKTLLAFTMVEIPLPPIHTHLVWTRIWAILVLSVQTLHYCISLTSLFGHKFKYVLHEHGSPRPPMSAARGGGTSSLCVIWMVTVESIRFPSIMRETCLVYLPRSDLFVRVSILHLKKRTWEPATGSATNMWHGQLSSNYWSLDQGKYLNSVNFLYDIENLTHPFYTIEI